MTIKEGFAKIPTFFKWLGKDLKEIGITFREGGFKTRISYLIMGLGQLLRGQYVRGIAMLAGQIALLAFIFGFGGQYLVQLGTLGTRARITNPNGTVSYGDNSFFILLYGILTIVVILLYLLLWRLNLKQNHEADQLLAKGKKLPSNRSDLSSLLNRNFDKTLLALPVIGIFVFTVLPILFMIGVAFTNYDFNHQPPGKLFSWVGFENFKNLFSTQGSGSFGTTFFTVSGAHQALIARPTAVPSTNPARIFATSGIFFMPQASMPFTAQRERRRARSRRRQSRSRRQGARRFRAPSARVLWRSRKDSREAVRRG